MRYSSSIFIPYVLPIVEIATIEIPNSILKFYFLNLLDRNILPIQERFKSWTLHKYIFVVELLQVEQKREAIVGRSHGLYYTQ